MNLLLKSASLSTFFAAVWLYVPCIQAQQLESISFSAHSSNATIISDATIVEPKQVELKPKAATQILLIVEPDCKPCDKLLEELESEFQPMRAANWKIDRGDDAHIRIINKQEAVELLGMSVEEAKEMQLPKLLAVHKNEVVRFFKAGCSTPLDRWTFDWMFTGIDKRPAPPPIQPITVATTDNYPLRGSHWSVDGDWHPSREKVLYHLRGPSHRTQLRPEWQLEAWSREELRSLHDNLHELTEYGHTKVYSSSMNAANYVVHQ